MAPAQSSLEAQLTPLEIINALRDSQGEEVYNELMAAHESSAGSNIELLKSLVTENDVKRLHRLHVDTCAERDQAQKNIDSILKRIKSHGDPLGDKTEEYRATSYKELDEFMRLQDKASSVRSAMNTLKDVLEFRRRNSQS